MPMTARAKPPELTCFLPAARSRKEGRIGRSRCKVTKIALILRCVTLRSMRVTIEIQGEVKELGPALFVSSCPELDIHSQGRTLEEARISLEDALRLYLTQGARRGILEGVLAKRGIRVKEDSNDRMERRFERPRDFEFAVPIELVVDAQSRGLIGGSQASWRP